MRVLIVEDDINKRVQLVTTLQALGATIMEAASYNSGARLIANTQFELIVLDMTLPTFDISAREEGGRRRPFGGLDILQFMADRGVEAQVIIVTQFESFGSGEHSKTLAELSSDLRQQFPETYMETIYYHPSFLDWREQLESAYRTVAKNGEDR